MKKRLKIGLFIDTFFPYIDGVVIVVDNLARELSKYNDVIVVAPVTNDVSGDKKLPYKVLRVPSIPVPFTEYRLVNKQTELSESYKELIKEDFDIIHIHSPFNIGRLGLKIANKINIPCIATMHTRFDFEIRKRVFNEKIVKRIMKMIIKVYNECDKCIAVNHAMKKVFKDYGYKYEPIVIYNGTDLKKSTNIVKETEIFQKYNLTKDIPTLLFVGRIIDIKNVFFILKSLKFLKEDGYKFKMIYVGTGPDLNKLKKKCSEYNMNDFVIFTGKITDREELSALYKISDLFLFPSIFDASSLVQIEAAVNETPGLFIEGSVTADTIINNINGFTCIKDHEIFKNRIIEILKDRKKLEEVSKEAAKTLGKSWEDLSKETYNLYIEEINKK